MSGGQGAAERRQPVPSWDTIKVTVKTLTQKEQFEVAQSSTIQEFKVDIAERFQTSPDLLLLISAGQVLKDGETLSQQGLRSGASVHVVVRSRTGPQAEQGSDATLTQRPSRSHSSLFRPGSTADLQTPGAIPPTLAELLTSGQDTVAQTMELVLSWILRSGRGLDSITHDAFLLGFLLGVTGLHLLSPGSVGLVSSSGNPGVPVPKETERTTFPEYDPDNTDVVRDLVMSTPWIQQLAEGNPEIGHILSDPRTIQEILCASSSPAVLQEMIRNYDVAVSNLESIPGGYGALERLYKEVEEPILDAVEAQLGNRLFAAVGSSPPRSGAALPAHTENRRPLPNPWAPRRNAARDDDDDGDGRGASGGFTLLSLGPERRPAVPNSGLVRSVAQQLTESPELMHRLGSALADPDGPAQKLLSSACVSSGGNSAPQGEWEQRLPPGTESAAVAPLLRSPRALRALLQIQLGLQTLAAEVPAFMRSLEESRAEESPESMSESPASVAGSLESVAESLESVAGSPASVAGSLESVAESLESVAGSLESVAESPASVAESPAASSRSSESGDSEIVVSDEDEAPGAMEVDEEAPQGGFKGQLGARRLQDRRTDPPALVDAEGGVDAAPETPAKAPSPNETP